MRRGAVISICASATVLVAVGALVGGQHGLGAEEGVANFFAGPINYHVIRAAMLLTNPKGFVCAVFALSILTVFWDRLGAALLLVGLLGGEAVSELVFKPLVGRHKGHSLAYPSGHALAACLIGTGVVLFFLWAWPKRKFWLAALFCMVGYVLFVFWVILSRRYHYPSDIIGSAAWAGVVAAVLLLAREALPGVNRTEPPR